MPALTDKQALEILSRLFPAGLGDSCLLAEACPEGWANSPIHLAFHPPPEQQYDEHCRWLRSMAELRQPGHANHDPPPSIPSFEEFIAKQHEPRQPPMSDLEEWVELLGDCLWDILSNNHELILQSGETANFGSFRMVSALIDEFADGGSLAEFQDRGGTMRFYMGSAMIQRRTDLGPVYQLIFRRFKALGYRWRYSFPRIYAIRFDEEPTDTLHYDPSAAFAAEEALKKMEEEEMAFQEKRDKEHAEAKRRALDQAPPAVVSAYQEIFGEEPQGWPPSPDSRNNPPSP